LARKPIGFLVLINFDKNCPVFSFSMLLTRTFSASRLSDVEDEHASRLKHIVDSPKETPKLDKVIVPIKEIIQTLAERRNCRASRKLGFQQRTDSELG